MAPLVESNPKVHQGAVHYATCPLTSRARAVTAVIIYDRDMRLTRIMYIIQRRAQGCICMWSALARLCLYVYTLSLSERFSGRLSVCFGLDWELIVRLPRLSIRFFLCSRRSSLSSLLSSLLFTPPPPSTQPRRWSVAGQLKLNRSWMFHVGTGRVASCADVCSVLYSLMIPD